MNSLRHLIGVYFLLTAAIVAAQPSGIWPRAGVSGSTVTVYGGFTKNSSFNSYSVSWLGTRYDTFNGSLKLTDTVRPVNTKGPVRFSMFCLGGFSCNYFYVDQFTILDESPGNFERTSVITPAFIGSSAIQGIAAADLDTDLDADLIIVGRNSNGTRNIIEFHPSNGDGTFAPGVLIDDFANTSDTRFFNVTAADIDQDELKDILVASGDNIVVYINNGSGTFESRKTYDMNSRGFAQSPIQRIYAYDLDQNGRIDILWQEVDTQNDWSDVGWCRGLSGGAFEVGTRLLLTKSFADPISAHDVNGDGIYDLLTENGAYFSAFVSPIGAEQPSFLGGIAIDLNDNGTPTPARNIIDAIDINADGFMDAITRNSFLLNNQSGNITTFEEVPFPFVQNSFQPDIELVVNIDDDSDLDVLTLNAGQSIEVYQNIWNGADITSIDVANKIKAESVGLDFYVEMPSGTNLSTINPTINISKGASFAASSTDYTQVVTYSVTSESGITKNWAIDFIFEPAQPQATLQKLFSQDSIHLDWDDIPDAVSYSVDLQLKNQNGIFSSVAGFPQTITSSAIGLLGFQSDSEYRVQISAENIIGTVSAEESVSFTTPPSASTAIAATNITTETFIANWNTVSSATSYSLDLSSDNFETILRTIENITGLSQPVDNLTGNQTYQYRIRAVNEFGSSTPSNPVSVLTIPNAPQLSEVLPLEIGQNTAILRWNDISPTYVVELSSTDFAQSTNYVLGFPLELSNTDSLNIGVNPSTFSLSASTQYWARIKSKNASGLSESSNGVTFLTRPSSVNSSSINFSNISQTSAQVTWTRVQNVTDYRYDLSLDENFSEVLPGFDNIPVSSSSAQVVESIEGLSTGTTFFLRIRSVNATGEATASTPVSFTTGPTNPTMGSAIDITSFSALVTWNKVNTATDYRLDVSSTNFSSYVNGFQNKFVADTVNLVNNLQPGVTYKARVVAYNSSSNSGFSDTLEFITVPAAPFNLATSNITLTGARCSWGNPGGVTSYDFQLSTSQTFADTLFESNTTATNIDLADLTQRTVYYFRVRANNASGSSSFEVSNFETDGEENIAPTGYTLSNRSIDENLPIGTFVGKLTTTDANVIESHTYTFSGSGNDNNDFLIKDDSLFTNSDFNFETKSTYTIEIRTTDSGGLSFTGTEDITIRDINDAPTDLILTGNSIVAFSIEGTTIGSPGVTDEDANETHVYSIDTDTEAFVLEGTNLNSNIVFTNEEDSTTSLILRATDSEGAFVTASFEILIEKFVDLEEPMISNLSDPGTFVAGSDPLALSVDVSDFRISSVTFYTRALTSETFQATDVSDQSGPYTITVQEESFDGVGLEYYVVAEDASGNIGESDKLKISLSLPEASSPTISSITRFGGEVEDYEIIAIPFNFDGTGNRVQEIFDEYNGGIPDKTIWRLIGYDPSDTETNQGLRELVASSPINIGVGYFFNARESAEIKIGAATVNNTDPQEIVLRPGWNLIGNPYIIPIDWSSVLARNGIPEVGPLRVIDPNDPARWPESNLLEEFKGAFVNLMAESNQTITIKFEDEATTSGGRLETTSDIPDYNWFLSMGLEQDGNKGTGSVGMHDQAKVGVDQFDALTLPRWVRYLEMNFSHPEFSYGSFSKDIVPVEDTYSWDFEVSSDKDGVTNLNWDKLGDVANLKLLDVSEQQVIDMLARTSYSFNLKGTKSFKIFYSQDPNELFLSDRITLGDAYPNPFSEQISIPISLPASDALFQVSMDVMDLSGRIFWSMQDQLAPGINELTMNRPSSLAPGLYMFKIKIKSSEVEREFTKKITVK